MGATRNQQLKSAAINLLLVAGSLALALAGAEVWLRAGAYLADRDALLDDLHGEPFIATAASRDGRVKVTRVRQIQPSLNDRIVYELRPNLRLIDDAGNEYTHNEHGFRGTAYPHAKSARTIRIVGLGDSYMYGNGVSDDEGFLVLVEARLNAEYPDARWEIVNTAVNGYNTVMEVATLEEKGLAFAPDLVAILFVGNDLDLPNFIRERVDPFARRSFFGGFVAQRLGSAEPVAESRDSESGVLYAVWKQSDPEKVPKIYRDMVGPEAYKRAMRRLHSLSAEHGFELVVLQALRREIVTETCAELDVPLVRFRARVTEYMLEHGITDWIGSELSVSDTNPHPSAIGHRLYADVFFDYLVDSGTVERLLSELPTPTSEAEGSV